MSREKKWEKMEREKEKKAGKKSRNVEGRGKERKGKSWKILLICFFRKIFL